MSSKRIKLILVVVIGVPAALVAVTFAAVLALRSGSSTDVAAPVEINAGAKPELLGAVDAEVKLSEPTNSAALPIQRDLTRTTQQETVKHLATGSGPYGEYNLFILDEVVTDTVINTETLEHCILAYEGLANNDTNGGGMCSPEEFVGPQHFQFHSVTPGSVEVALFYAEEGSQTMTVETKNGYVVSSNLINGVGFVQYNAAKGQPRWITLFDAGGQALWSQQIS